MATFLELCADLARESGAIGSAPSAVTGQTGRQEKAVEWIADAWRRIQTSNPDWTFLRKELSGTLAAGTKQYTASALGLSDWARWIVDVDGYQPFSIYTTGEQENEANIRLITYERWRRSYNFGTHDAGKPIYYAIAPSGDLCVGPNPDAAYVIRGEYQRTPQVLTTNTDEPIAPERFHQAIVHRARMLLAAHDEAWPAYQAAERDFNAMMFDMQRDCLPIITAAGNTLR